MKLCSIENKKELEALKSLGELESKVKEVRSQKVELMKLSK